MHSPFVETNVPWRSHAPVGSVYGMNGEVVGEETGIVEEEGVMVVVVVVVVVVAVVEVLDMIRLILPKYKQTLIEL